MITCQRAYLVHVDERYIRHTLFELRKLSLEPAAQLHKKKQYFTYAESDRLPNLDGPGLFSTIQTLIGSSPEDYSSKKLQTIETVGYEDGGHSGTFRFVIPDKWSSNPSLYWVDFTLGLIPGIETQYVEIRDTRFGVDIPALAQTFHGGRMEIQRVPVGKAHLIFSSVATDRQLRILVDVYAPQGILPEMEMDYRKLRFESEFVDLIVHANGGQLKLRFPPPNQLCKLSRLYEVASLCLSLFESSQEKCVVTSEIWRESERIGSSQINPDEFKDLFDEQNLKMAMAIINAVSIAKDLDIPLDTQVKTSELHFQESIIQLQSNLLSGRTGSHLRVRFEMLEIENELPICVPLLPQSIIGEHRIIVSGVVLGYPDIIENSEEDTPYRIELTTTEPVYKRVWVSVRDVVPKQAMKGMLQSILDEYSESHTVVVFDDFQELLDSDDE